MDQGGYLVIGFLAIIASNTGRGLASFACGVAATVAFAAAAGWMR